LFIIGLTGGIASGKSTVAKMLVEKGAYLLDADLLAREAVEPGKPAWEKIVQWLGETILLPDRTINREKLGNIVFNNKEKLSELNRIVHPWVGQEFIRRADEIKANDPQAVLVYDIPLLIEAGMQKVVDLVLLVYLSEEIQISRLQLRNNLSHTEAVKRVRSQTPLAEKKKHAHRVIDNSGTLAETADQVDQFWQWLKARI